MRKILHITFLVILNTYQIYDFKKIYKCVRKQKVKAINTFVDNSKDPKPSEYILDKRFLILTFLWKLKFPNHDMFASQGKIYRMPLGLVNLLKAKGTLLTDIFST